MIAPTNRPSSNPVYFGTLVWADSVAQQHTWSTAVQAAAEVDWGECATIISLLQSKMLMKVFGWVTVAALLPNFPEGLQTEPVRWSDSNGSHWMAACAWQHASEEDDVMSF